MLTTHRSPLMAKIMAHVLRCCFLLKPSTSPQIDPLIEGHFKTVKLRAKSDTRSEHAPHVHPRAWSVKSSSKLFVNFSLHALCCIFPTNLTFFNIFFVNAIMNKAPDQAEKAQSMPVVSSFRFQLTVIFLGSSWRGYFI